MKEQSDPLADVVSCEVKEYKPITSKQEPSQYLLDLLHRMPPERSIDLFLILEEVKTEASEALDSSHLRIEQFPDYKAFRQASLNARKQQVEMEMGQTLAALRGIGLDAIGSLFGQMVIVRATAAQIRTALALPGVLGAWLDPTTDYE